MENSGFNLMAGVIAATVLLMGIVMYSSSVIYNSATSTITDSYGAMSTQEKEAFNNQFAIYEGTQTGNMVKALIGVLTSNSNIYQEETDKIPSLIIGDKINSAGDEVEDAIIESSEELYDYKSNLEIIKNKIESKHTYTVEIHYDIKGIIDKITIYYEEQ